MGSPWFLAEKGGEPPGYSEGWRFFTTLLRRDEPEHDFNSFLWLGRCSGCGTSVPSRAAVCLLAGGPTLPGMPPELSDPDDEDEVRPGKGRFGGPRNPWWRPASMGGRVLLGVSLLTVLAGLTVGTLYLKNYLGRDGRFRIAGSSNIEATGLTEVSRKQMLPVFGEDIGRNIFFVPLSERRRELEEIPWVEHATVMRVLPDQIRVSLVERKPVAFVRQGNTIGLVDANGVLLSMPAATMAQHHYSFPVVTGIDPADPIASRKARMAVYLRMVADLDQSNQHFSEQISEIDLTDPEDARVLMPEQGDDILAHFGEDKFAERYRRYKEHIAEWRKQYPRLASVDLRYEQQVVLQMKNASTVEEGSGDKAAAEGEKDNGGAAGITQDGSGEDGRRKDAFWRGGQQGKGGLDRLGQAEGADREAEGSKRRGREGEGNRSEGGADASRTGEGRRQPSRTRIQRLRRQTRTSGTNSQWLHNQPR
jgi:cell division protein FtsQ